MRKAILITIICALVMVLALQPVNAGEIFNDEVHDNEAFYINSVKHIARYYPSAEKVSILIDTERVLVELEDCADFGQYQYCLDSAVDGIDDETGDPASTMTIRVLQSGPEISIDRDVSEDEPDINGEVEVIATITNDGNERANNVN